MGIYMFILIVFLSLGSAWTYAADSSMIHEVAAMQNEELKSMEIEGLEHPAAEKPKSDAVKEETTQKADGQKAAAGEEQISEGEEEPGYIADPLFPWNNAMYHFNDKLYFWVMKPVAKTYSSAFPEDIRTAVSNFFYNLTTPIRFVNNLLQLKLKNAGDELIRFVYNSTAGVGGLADMARADLKISRHDEDLGRTLGSYGVGQGFYIVWPFLGPSSLRDTVGLIGDGFLDPVYYVNPWEASLEIAAYDKVNDTSLHIGDYEDLIEAAVDPYVAIRDAYVQHRKKKVEE